MHLQADHLITPVYEFDGKLLPCIFPTCQLNKPKASSIQVFDLHSKFSIRFCTHWDTGTKQGHL